MILRRSPTKLVTTILCLSFTALSGSKPPVVFARNDGNLTRMEVLVGTGRINQILKVLVNNVEIPEGIGGRDMTGSGWWNLVANGGRAGGFNPNFVDQTGTPLGDPYGSMAALSVVVPNQINDGRVLPRVKVLVEGRVNGLMEDYPRTLEEFEGRFGTEQACRVSDATALAEGFRTSVKGSGRIAADSAIIRLR